MLSNIGASVLGLPDVVKKTTNISLFQQAKDLVGLP